MAEYQCTSERWECEDCGEVGHDIVPSHDCPMRECDECHSKYDTRDEGNSEHCQECMEVLAHFLIDGYWKDSKEPFENYKVKESDEFDNGDDETVFFYGLSKADILEAIELGEDTVNDFVITSVK